MIEPLECDRLRTLLNDANLAAAEDVILPRAHPMIMLGLAEQTAREQRKPLEAMAIGASRWGGTPDVPADFVWPHDRAGNPFHFLMQLDLGGLPKLEDWPLPSSGRLYVFAGMPGGDYAIDAHVSFSAADAQALVRVPAAPACRTDDLFAEYFPPVFDPFLLTASVGIDIEYRRADEPDMMTLIEWRYPHEHSEALIGRYLAVVERAADARHSELAGSGYPLRWWQVGQLFGATNRQHQEESAARYARRSSRPATLPAADEASRWRRLVSLESNTVTGFDSLCDARPYRLLARDPLRTPWTELEVETHIETG
jgi:hypothetical protein